MKLSKFVIILLMTQSFKVPKNSSGPGAKPYSKYSWSAEPQNFKRSLKTKHTYLIEWTLLHIDCTGSSQKLLPLKNFSESSKFTCFVLGFVVSISRASLLFPAPKRAATYRQMHKEFNRVDLMRARSGGCCRCHCRWYSLSSPPRPIGHTWCIDRVHSGVVPAAEHHRCVNPGLNFHYNSIIWPIIAQHV